jgi:hypothetical protein
LGRDDVSAFTCHEARFALSRLQKARLDLVERAEAAERSAAAAERDWGSLTKSAVRDLAAAEARVGVLEEALLALVDVMVYLWPNPNSPHAAKWEEQREAALDLAAAALAGSGPIEEET